MRIFSVRLEEIVIVIKFQFLIQLPCIFIAYSQTVLSFDSLNFIASYTYFFRLISVISLIILHNFLYFLFFFFYQRLMLQKLFRVSTLFQLHTLILINLLFLFLINFNTGLHDQLIYWLYATCAYLTLFIFTHYLKFYTLFAFIYFRLSHRFILTFWSLKIVRKLSEIKLIFLFLKIVRNHFHISLRLSLVRSYF